MENGGGGTEPEGGRGPFERKGTQRAVIWERERAGNKNANKKNYLNRKGKGICMRGI